MDIFDFNPWWETGEIERDVKTFKKRDLFNILANSLEKRYIDIITGLRRVGKTTIIYQLINELLERNINPKNIFYFSFDIEKKDLTKILREYEEKVLRRKIKDTKVYLFFDEIHKLDNWEDRIKVIYDLNPKVKIVLSGSSSLNILKSGKESLVGRAKFHYLPPLTFKEFLRFKDVKIPKKDEIEIHERKLSMLLHEFISRGFPETLEMNDKEVEEYVRELVVERIIYRDIPESFHIEDIEIVKILANYIFENPGVIINIDSLSSDLGRHKKTIINALNYLELFFLIKRVSNIRNSFLATSRKNRKAYPLHSSLSFSKSEDLTIETLVRSELNAGLYWRKSSYEVDYVIQKNGTLIPVEIKNKEKISKKDMKSIIKFCELFKVNEGYIVTKGEETEIKFNKISIKVIPLVNFLLFNK